MWCIERQQNLSSGKFCVLLLFFIFILFFVKKYRVEIQKSCQLWVVHFSFFFLKTVEQIALWKL